MLGEAPRELGQELVASATAALTGHSAAGLATMQPQQTRHRVASSDKEVEVALARVVTFDGVSRDRMAQMQKDMESGDPPEGFPSSELLVLHDGDAEKSLVVVIFDNEDDYKKGDEMLSAMPAGDTPGQRTSVTKYDVAMRMKS
jgi:hypothetical protein